MADSSAFPWLKHLPEDEQRKFFEELNNAFGEAQFSTMPGVLVSPETYARHLDLVIAAWRATAEVWADAELRKALTEETLDLAGDLVEAPRPELPQRASSPRKICLASIANPQKAHGAHWCSLATGHPGDHRSRLGRTWTDADMQQARTLDEFPGPRHGE